MKLGKLNIKSLYLGKLPITSMYLGNLPIPVDGGGEKEGNFKLIGLDDNLEEATGSDITCWGITEYTGNDAEIVMPNYHKDLLIKKICDNALYENENITSVVLPEYLEVVGNYAFGYCSNLTSVVFGNYITYLGEYSFKNCDLIYATLPSSLLEIQSYAFENNSNLINVYFPNNCEITYIGNGAFSYCNSLTTINLPNTIEYMGEYVFNGCSSLQSLTLPSSLTTIENYSFQSCSNLQSLILGDDVEYINGYAFSFCDSLSDINIPLSMEGMYGSAFYSSQEERNVYYDGTIDDWFNCYMDYNGNPLYCRTNLTSSNIVKGGKLYLLDNNGSVTYNNKTYSLATNITLPNNITNINMSYLSYCSSIEKLIIPSNVQNIQRGAFQNCINLTVVDIKEGLLQIGSTYYSQAGYAFQYCRNLEKIVIPTTVTYIGAYSFQYCSKVRVYYKGNASQWTTLKSSIYTGNTYITNKTPYYYSEEEPASSPSSYWHYVDDEPTLWG